MAKKYLVIVESPTKAKTIAKFLGKEYTVLSSFGHVRDLPTKKTGVDIAHDFAPSYVVPLKAKKVVAELKKAAAGAEIVYFASDEDREGEAISWHLSEILDVYPTKTKRITFHEITESAIRAALEHPRAIDQRLVDAQQARRILDRLVGYELSPFLWRKVTYGLSAGRVQSVTVRLIVEREREIQAFVAKEYWSIEALLHKKNQTETFVAKLSQKNGETLDKFAVTSEAGAKKIIDNLADANWNVASIEQKKSRRAPYAPFTTSTLQQEANNRLGFSAKQTMMLAQQLYEGVELGTQGSTGLITYMRTDSTNLAEKFVEEARAVLTQKYGAGAVPDEARKYKTKSKGAQEAHEAVRPTQASLTPDDAAPYLDSKQLKLYTLIWQRALASQMVDAEFLSVTAQIDAKKENANDVYTFRASGSTLLVKGFLEIYPTDTKEILLPELTEGEHVFQQELAPKQHFTEPPPRYTEATIVKTLEENGIGRPSTYAPTISTVIDRGYVEKEERKLKPTDLAFLVSDLLVANFPEIVDYQFTAGMEDNLDAIAEGEKEWVPILREFYEPFHKNLEEKEKEISKKDVTEEKTDALCDKCGKPMIIKFGRFGKFLACTGYPECKTTKPLPGSKEAEQAKAAAEQTSEEKCPTCGAPMIIKRGRFGPFLGCSTYPDCKTIVAIQKKTGVTCPKCTKGDVIEKKTRAGRIFFSCSTYPTCDFALWARPTGAQCPKCTSLLVFAKADKIACSNKECHYIKDKDE